MITILIVNYNSSDFIFLNVHALNKLGSNKYQILIVDNGSNTIDKFKLYAYLWRFDNVTIYSRKQTKAGSFGHAEALDELVRRVNTKYFMVLDADVCILSQDWDKRFLRYISSTCKACGTQAPGNKDKDFPLMFAALYETSVFKKLECTFSPLANGDEILLDTGCQIKYQYMSAGYTGKVFNELNTRSCRSTPYKNIICTVYYDQDFLVASHFGRGSTSGSAKIKSNNIKNKVFNKIYAKMSGMAQKYVWILRSYHLLKK